MIPGSFEYIAPSSVDEALALLKENGESAKLLAGGHSLIPTMKLRLAEPEVIVDLNRIGALKGISESSGTLIIGALTTHYELETSDLAHRKIPLLAQTAAAIGDVQVRNKGTIGGSLAHADPAADWPAAILALDAEIKAVGQGGERSIKASDFFEDLYTTAIDPEEIITEIHVPIPGANTKGTYLKLPQIASGFALAGVAVILTQVENICQNLAVGVTGVSSVPYRAAGVESDLRGKAFSSDNIAAAAEKAVDGIDDVLEDIHASEAYRKNLAKVYTRRAIESAAS
ncbi:MAG: xanthine dehydrogenase family protein subunit M [Candidatus Poribacteria bacterium]|nr:xanthine dehydrogenase family protein subunit M [Candidatus Poribacteria bacterium]